MPVKSKLDRFLVVEKSVHCPCFFGNRRITLRYYISSMFCTREVYSKFTIVMILGQQTSNYVSPALVKILFIHAVICMNNRLAKLNIPLVVGNR